MKIRALSLLAGPIVAAALVSPLATGCDKDDVGNELKEPCGPCGVVAQGDVGISGNAKLDGFFKAVADLNGAVASANGEFEAALSRLEAAYGVVAAGDLNARVDGLIAAIKADLAASLEGGATAALAVNYAPPKCSANVNVAFEAQAQCEAKAGCTADVSPGEVKVQCSGKCEGKCEGTCSGTAQCKTPSASVQCAGSCEGSCSMDGTAACDGTCRGDCSGSCSAYDGEGKCAGACNGNCTGNCELKAAAQCAGTCTGSCTAAADPGGCSGEAKCEGTCSGQCSGGCEGEATPPSASASCEAAADCQAQAKAQGSANVECTPPSLEIGYQLNATVAADANGSAAFAARIGALKAEGAAMLKSFAQLSALADGKVNGEVVFNPAPIAAVAGQLNGVVQAGATGSLFAGIPKARLTCVIPAMSAAVGLLGNVAGEASASVQAQGKFAAFLVGG